MSGWFLLASAIMQYQRKTKLLNYIKKKENIFLDKVAGFMAATLLKISFTGFFQIF